MFKPPKGAVIKSHGAERLGKGVLGIHQVRIKEMNENEPLQTCRD